MKTKILTFIKKDTVLAISFLLAIGSSCLIHPDKEYIDYIDWKTLGLLFCLMAVMVSLQKLGLFDIVGSRLLSHTKHSKQLSLILVFLPFFFSMLITNDVALIAFVPFAIIVLRMANLEKRIVITVVLQTIAANLGSMLTPMGNPQNLYLYAQSNMSLRAFVLVMLPYTITAACFLLFACLLGKKESIDTIKMDSHKQLPVLPSILDSILFILCLLSVANLIPVIVVFLIVLLYFLFADRATLIHVDYSLLGTFFFFFIFIGNMERIHEFRSFIESIVTNHESIVAILSSQFISNVPSALLLSGFTSNWEALIVGINLGGLGSLIASMASLISYKQIAREYPSQRGRYILTFTITSLLMLAVLYGLLLLL